MTPRPASFRLTACLLLLTLAPAHAADKPAFASLLPSKGNTGGAVVIVSATDTAPLARWLADRGLAVFTLPAAATAADAAGTVQYLRTHAPDYKASPKRIALLGYAGGADLAAEVAYNQPAEAKPDLVALIWASAPPAPATGGTKPPPTFLVGSTSSGDNLTGSLDLWAKLRAARASVDGHFFAHADLTSVLSAGNESVSTWPEMFFNWARFSGLLTDEPRLPVKGMVWLDGRPLPHGYVIFTPVDFVGAGPIIGRVLNSTAGSPIGEFVIAASNGPIAGRYKVDVRQNMNRWLSNSFSSDLVGGRGGGSTPEKAYFGHYRVLAPSIDDQHSFTKVHPTDKTDYLVEFTPGAEANSNLKIEVFSK